MNRFAIALLVPALTVLAQYARCLAGGDESSQPSLARTSELTRAGSSVSLPGLTIQGGEKKSVEATGKVSLTDGILEFMACEAQGRDYESIFSLDCKPSALQFALLLIGCESGALPQRAKVGEKVGDRLRIEVEWQVDGKAKRVPIEQLMVARRTKKPPSEITWIFTGSYFVKDLAGRDLFQADAEQAFISLWWNPAIPINLAGDFGNPYRADDQGFRVNLALIPPKGAPVKVIFRKWKD